LKPWTLDRNAGEICRSSLRYVFKPTLAEGKNSIISRTMGSKLVKMIYKAKLSELKMDQWMKFDVKLGYDLI
jgi:phosphoenolpyruvate synthase/pyruvate phosphate dikinase